MHAQTTSDYSGNDSGVRIQLGATKEVRTDLRLDALAAVSLRFCCR